MTPTIQDAVELDDLLTQIKSLYKQSKEADNKITVLNASKRDCIEEMYRLARSIIVKHDLLSFTPWTFRDTSVLQSDDHVQDDLLACVLKIVGTIKINSNVQLQRTSDGRLRLCSSSLSSFNRDFLAKYNIKVRT